MNTSNLTIETLKELMKPWENLRCDLNPFQLLAKTHRLDLNDGAILIVPEDLMMRFPELEPYRNTKGVHITQWLPGLDCFLMDGKKIEKEANERNRQFLEQCRVPRFNNLIL